MAETKATKPPTPEQMRVARESRRTWYGYLAEDNAPHLRDRIDRMLRDRPYTFVSTNADMRTIPPEVRTTQRLAKPPQVADPGHIVCVDSRYAWGISSSYSTEEEAYKAASEGAQDVTYVHIEGDGTGDRDRIEIRMWNLMNPRELLHWVVVPEHPEWDEAAVDRG